MPLPFGVPVFRNKARLKSWINATHSDVRPVPSSFDLTPVIKGRTGWAVIGEEYQWLVACVVFKGVWRYELCEQLPHRPMPGARGTYQTQSWPVHRSPVRPLTTCGTANSY